MRPSHSLQPAAHSLARRLASWWLRTQETAARAAETLDGTAGRGLRGVARRGRELVTGLSTWKGLASAWRTAPLAELLAAAVLTSNAALFMGLTGSLGGDTGMALNLFEKITNIPEGVSALKSLFTSSYYPPLYDIWMLQCPWPGERLEPVRLLLWSNLGTMAALLAVCWAIRSRGTSRAAGAAFVIFLGCTPLFNAFMHRPHFECALLVCTLLTLALLLGSGEGLPDRGGSLLLGAVLGAGLLAKWTFPVYIAGPLLWQAWVCRRRTGGTREPFRRLLTAGLAALLVAGPWYLTRLDFQHLLVTTANDPTPVDPSGRTSYLLRLHYYGMLRLPAVVGPHFMWLVCLGAVAGLLSRRAVALPALLSTLVPVGVLSLFVHAEDRYLLAALPGLALAAAAGLDALHGRWRSLAVGLVAVLGILSQRDLTWRSVQPPIPRFSPDPGAIFDPDYRLYRIPRQDSERLYQRVRDWVWLLPRRDGPATFAIHPFEQHRDLKSGGLRMAAHALRNDPTAPRMAGYEAVDYPRFVLNQRDDPVDVLLLSRALLAVPPDAAGSQARWANSLINQEGMGRTVWLDELPEDLFMLDEIAETYGVAETLSLPRGNLWILIRKDRWSRARAQGQLAELPRDRAAHCDEPALPGTDGQVDR